MTVLRAATRAAAALCLVAAATVGIATPPAQAAPTHVAIAVDFGGGNVQVACAPSGGNGSDVLGSRFQVQYNKVGLVAIIDDVGSMAPPTDLYWSYWHSANGDSWSYASTGPATFHPAAGTVEGWAYNDGSSGPAASPNYAAICAGQDPAPAPTHATSRPQVHQPSATPPAQPGQPLGPGRPARGEQRDGTARHATTGPESKTGDGSRAPARRHVTTGRSAVTTAGTDPSRPSTSAPARLVAARRDSTHTSAVPALGTALALVAAAAIGGTAFWRLRRRQGW